MSLATQIALTSTPLALYFLALGFFHGGRRPRVVAGPVDVGLLAFGLSGLIGFGPIGRAIMSRVVGPGAGLVPWSIWFGVLVLWGLVFAGFALRRVAVYNVTPDELGRALAEALDHLGGRFAPTIHGFEDSARKTGLTVKLSRSLHAAGIESYGEHSEFLIQELKPHLNHALRRLHSSRRRSPISRPMFALAAMTICVPIAGMLMANPQSLRALLHSIRWW